MLNWNPAGQSQRKTSFSLAPSAQNPRDENKDKNGWNENLMRDVLKYAVISLLYDLGLILSLSLCLASLVVLKHV